MFHLSNDDWQLLLVGSSNCTRAGLGVGTGSANLEANLAYVIRAGDRAARLADHLWPETSDLAIDLESPSVKWDAIRDPDADEATRPPLPRCFEEALFEAGANPALVVALGEQLPARWVVRSPDGEQILSSTSWVGGAGESRHQWAGRAVPFMLDVEWQSESGTAIAEWPVNVADPGELPPPEGLGDLTLEELIAVLSSTRPLHVSFTAILRRRLPVRENKIELDPHRRVNTETFLLRRTRRLAVALERMRERLERPAVGHEALDWRLRGPIGPLALARAFIREGTSTGEKRFCLAEIALAVGRVRVASTAAAGMKPAAIRGSLRQVTGEIEELLPSSGSGTPDGMDEYVRSAFEEASR